MRRPSSDHPAVAAAAAASASAAAAAAAAAAFVEGLICIAVAAFS